MTEDRKPPDAVHAALGYRHLSRFWAKVEIFFGLGAAGVGMLLGFWAVSRQTVQLPWAGAALLLFMLGWYLALAGGAMLVFSAGLNAHAELWPHDVTARNRRRAALKRIRFFLLPGS